MKTPRDISGKEIIKALKSHIMVTTMKNGEHHLTIPNHSPLKIGTLNEIVSQVAQHFNVTKEQALQKLFG